MNQLRLANELIATYRKHGWRLRRVLVTPQRADELQSLRAELSEVDGLKESTLDALWFSRPSHGEREAWELRLISENAYALFETFEKDEDEELREDARLEMEARMREKISVA